MVPGRHIVILMIIIMVFPFVFADVESADAPTDPRMKPMTNSADRSGITVEDDPVIRMLGMRFEEVERTLGQPDDEGYEEAVFGPHNYLHYRTKEGDIRFASPASVEDPIVNSIIMGSGGEIGGVRVGMTFEEIVSRWGPPTSDPQLGMNDTYYMDYFFGETESGAPDIVISFSAKCRSCPTQDVFIKREDPANYQVGSAP